MGEWGDMIPISLDKTSRGNVLHGSTGSNSSSRFSPYVTQRGNRQEAIFLKDGDHKVYRNLLAEQACRANVEVWAHCLMPNHVHLIVVPKRTDGLGLAVGEAHRRYTSFNYAGGG